MQSRLGRPQRQNILIGSADQETIDGRCHQQHRKGPRFPEENHRRICYVTICSVISSRSRRTVAGWSVQAILSSVACCIVATCRKLIRQSETLRMVTMDDDDAEPVAFLGMASQYRTLHLYKKQVNRISSPQRLGGLARMSHLAKCPCGSKCESLTKRASRAFLNQKTMVEYSLLC